MFFKEQRRFSKMGVVADKVFMAFWPVVGLLCAHVLALWLCAR